MRGPRLQMLRDESGFVIPIVLALMVIALAMGAAGVAESLSSRSLTRSDMRARRAQQAADSGIQTQRYQQAENQITNAGSSFDLNGGLLNLAHSLDCITPQFNVGLQITGLVASNVNSAGVCPLSGGGGGGPSLSVPQAVGNHAYDESEFIPGATTPVTGASEADLAPKIVGLGWDGTSTSSTSGNVFSREEAILAPISPLPVLGANGDLTVGGVSISGGLLGGVLTLLGLSSLATTVNGDLQAYNNMTLPSVDASLNLTLSNGLLGVVKYGRTLSPSNGIAVAQRVNATPPYREPVTVASSAVKASCPAADAMVPRQASCADFSSFYNAGTNTVTEAAGQTMTIPGGDYVFCNFTALGTVTAKPTSAAPVRIFIDSPSSARCNGNNPTQSTNTTFNHSEWSEGNFTAALGVTNTTPLNPSGVQLYVVGDQASNPYDDNTFVEIGTPGTDSQGGLLSTNPLTQALVAYAPTSDVSLTTAHCVTVIITNVCIPGTFTGNLIGDDVVATALTFTQDLNLGNFPLYNGVNVYRVKQYVQCTPQPTDSLGNKYSSLQANPAIDTNGC